MPEIKKLICSFCKNTLDKSWFFVKGETAYICSDCIGVCSSIMLDKVKHREATFIVMVNEKVDLLSKKLVK